MLQKFGDGTVLDLKQFQAVLESLDVAQYQEQKGELPVAAEIAEDGEEQPATVEADPSPEGKPVSICSDGADSTAGFKFSIFFCCGPNSDMPGNPPADEAPAPAEPIEKG